jgi:hypothetical protein
MGNMVEVLVMDDKPGKPFLVAEIILSPGDAISMLTS